jgi:hypothetical protein
MVGLFTANLLWLQISYAQRQYTSFGPVSERALGFVPAGLAMRASTIPARNQVAVLSPSPPSVHFYALADSGGIVPTGEVSLTGPRNGLLAADLDGDGEPEFITLHPEGTEASVLKRKGRSYVETVYGTPARGQKLAVADINNDGIPDILLFGKSIAGVATMLGRQGGGFTFGPELFSEVSISDLTTLDINGDGILDVIVVNWLSNELTLFYGISRMVFSEQLAVPLPGEPENIALTWLRKKRSFGVAVSLPAERKIALIRGTPDGDVQVEGTMALPGHPRGLAFALLNDDAFPDLVISTEKGIVVSPGAGEFDFLPPVLFGPGASPAGWALGDLDADRRTDLAIAEQGNQRLVFLGNARHTERSRWPATYAVGNRPLGLAVRDLDGDGLIDIAVVNSQSSSVSLLYNRGRGVFDGQLSVSVPDQPAHVSSTGNAAGQERFLLTSHPHIDRIGLVSWSVSPQGTTSTSIPTGSSPFALDAWQEGGALNILVRTGAHGSTPVSLSLFEQLSGRQFLERSLRASLPASISALTVDRPDGASYNVYFVSSDRGTKRATVSVASAGRDFATGRIRPLLSYDDSTGATRGIIRAGLRSPVSPDLIVNLGKPVNALGIAYRKEDGTYGETLEWIHDTLIEEDDDLVVLDVDRDGRMDLTVRNALSDMVVTYYGTGAGFQRGVPICSARGIRAIGIAPLVAPGVNDLVLARGNDGTVSIMHAPFRRIP